MITITPFHSDIQNFIEPGQYMVKQLLLQQQQWQQQQKPTKKFCNMDFIISKEKGGCEFEGE